MNSPSESHDSVEAAVMDASNHRAESLEVPPYSSGYGTSMPGASCSYSKPYGDAGEEESMIDPEVQPLLQKRVLDKKKARKKKLGMIFGVTIPCILSIFSYLLFLRLGFVVGQAGYLETLAMLLLGYAVVVLTVLSISAIATNGNVEGGGVYFMISRALGPEFGGSVGIIFFIANIFASATYVIAFVEALMNSFGAGGIGSLIPNCPDHNESCPGIPVEYGFLVLYRSVIALFCLLVCLVGAGLFAKTQFIIFLVVMFAVATSMFSFGYQEFMPISFLNGTGNASKVLTSNYTAFSFDTFVDNLLPHYTAGQSFQLVFAVLFNGCTGIMAGANISGDLSKPSFSIPVGTLFACAITFFIYIMLFTFTAFTCERELLLLNYNYLQDINVVRYFIAVGVFAATLSAALSTLIGASRVLQALAKDRLFSGVLHPFTFTVGKEPIVAVLSSWLAVQAVIFIPTLNTVAVIVTMFFLLSYGVVNIACLALKFASAPNFRPTFQVYARYTSLLGALGCFILMFVINPLYAAITLAVMVMLFIYLLLRAPATPWGDVSQALIYHQVRKFLLRLDIRKNHVKFWRPEILLLVANPRSSYKLIQFANELKKGGLYVLGHVVTKPFDTDVAEYYNRQLTVWLDFVDISKVKAFVELSISDSVRAGARNLLTCAGLGGMKPNILAMGFYSKEQPQDHLEELHNSLQKRPNFVRVLIRDESLKKYDRVNAQLPRLREEDEHALSQEVYVGMIQDAITMDKSVCIMRNFDQYRPPSQEKPYIDVWPMCVHFNEEFDNTFTMLLQLACVIHMKDKDKMISHSRIRIFVVVDSTNGTMEKDVLKDFLQEARIEASVIILPQMDGATDLFNTFTDSFTSTATRLRGTEHYARLNRMMKERSHGANVIFTSLPRVPQDIEASASYIKELDELSAGLPPTVMVHGTMPVISNDL